MEADLISLFVIVVTAAFAPFISAAIPNKAIPETVFLLVAGMILGPNVLDIAQEDAAVALFSDVGLGFLFLLAGYEINPKQLAGKQGRHGFLTWLVTFAIAMAICIAVPDYQEHPFAWMAAAICLTTTAFGTLVPILHERGLVGTRIGDAIYAYGTWGELAPIVATALILSTRTTWLTMLVLAGFALVAVLSAVVPKRIWAKVSAISEFFDSNRNTNAQINVRWVMMLLIGLLALSSAFDLDIVLGAFAAGFVLRFLVPEGDKGMEDKLNGIGYGFFIPLFFIVSGMAIDPAAVAQSPLLLLVFIAALIVVRAIPIFLALHISKETRSMDRHERSTVALYCTMALPLIVAITNVAVDAQAMSLDTASLLVAAGGITVFLMPFLASLTVKHIDRLPGGKEGGAGARPDDGHSSSN